MLLALDCSVEVQFSAEIARPRYLYLILLIESPMISLVSKSSPHHLAANQQHRAASHFSVNTDNQIMYLNTGNKQTKSEQNKAN